MKVITKFDSKILSSSHISFLFGAGVNGRAFPQLSGFKQTIEILAETIKRPVTNYEQDLNSVRSKAKAAKVNDSFIREFSYFESLIDYRHPDINDLAKLFTSVNKLIKQSENRTITTKQVNVYTLNYDKVVENTIHNLGYLCNVVSSTNIDKHDIFFDLVGFDYSIRKYIPTYLVSKIHGDIDAPILPGKDKFNEILLAKRFEILFKMKSHLSRINSVLIVIGYSGRDEHVNRLLKDCVSSGLTIFWFKYSETDYIPNDLVANTYIIEQEDQKNKMNTTLRCHNMLEELWDTQSEEL